MKDSEALKSECTLTDARVLYTVLLVESTLASGSLIGVVEERPPVWRIIVGHLSLLIILAKAFCVRALAEVIQIEGRAQRPLHVCQWRIRLQSDVQIAYMYRVYS